VISLRVLLIACALLLPGSVPAAAQPKGPKPAPKEKAAPATEKSRTEPAASPSGVPSWYAQRVSRGDAGLIVASLWSKGRLLRADTVISGVPITTIVNGEFYYVIDSARLVGMAVRRNTPALERDRTHPDERPFGREGVDLIAKGAELIRTESVAGRACKVFRLTDGMGRHEIWITDDETALPLRIDSSDRSGARVLTDYVDWLSQLSLADSFFEPDPRVQIERLEYQEYMTRAAEGPVGPAPVLFGDLLHGR
jgi:hypothetical protein